ncbi:Acg family FMN-binding oxidoreductase [Nocardia sp. CA-128927]|uniref:Acg family FMN-binding oxidoreductase n=1 Tax=Nocardia sp. CA-128927 TaxID=3239975 RepID=UPI003D97F516
MDAENDSGTPDLPTVRAALTVACRAPSVHNTQPWRWVFDSTWLFLYSDTDRRLPAADPQSRQLIVSCGAALDHARQAFVSMGWFAYVTRMPDPRRPELLAVFEFRPWCGPLNRTAARVRAIPLRHTDRLPMAAPDDWSGVLDTVRELARPHHVTVDEITDDDRPRLADATRQVTALRRHDNAYQDELYWWSGHSGPHAGVPVSALVSDAEAARVDVGRTFPSAPYSTRRPDLDDHSRLVVLSTIGDSPGQWLHTGEAMSELLLECTARGLTTGILTHITELTTTRAEIADLITQPGVPQVVIRIGTAPAETGADPTPRRPLSEVLEVYPAHIRNPASIDLTLSTPARS